MTPQDKETILRLLAQHRIMTVATVRPDGWPQATTVGYASEGLVLYFLCGRQSQKAVNIAADNRISLVIDHDTSDPMGIEGLSMAGRAYAVTDPAEMAKVLELMGSKFRKYLTLSQPDPSSIRLFMVVPEVVSILDYRKGFGHSDLTDADRGTELSAHIVQRALLRLAEKTSNWQLRPAPKLRNRHRPLPRTLHLQQAH
ncbi:MAG TPA: pyridoxamine 5'-phosphate oxidase family protein [Methyloceanibacter sp.]|nr:pyridoxamine 5'-phosphate oxidase family protein [Methyloceanibacter sp.]